MRDLVYNPCDDPAESVFTFNGMKFYIPPNADYRLELPLAKDGKNVMHGWERIPLAGLLDAALNQLGSLGLVCLTGRSDVDKLLREGAEKKHEEYLRSRFVPVLERWNAACKSRDAAKVTHPAEPEEVKVAKTRLKDWKLLIASLLLALGLAPQAQAQAGNFVYLRTLASGTTTYCKLLGALGDPFGSPIAQSGVAITSGSSTTVTSAAAFGLLLAPTATRGSVIVVSIDGGTTYSAYRVTAKASASSITIDRAADLTATGVPFGFYDEFCGTGNADGWIASKPGDVITVIYQGGSATASTSIECRGSGLGQLPVQIYPDNSAGAATRALIAADINNRYMLVITNDLRCTGVRVGLAGTNPIMSAFIERQK
jgi:hypothetical protein